MHGNAIAQEDPPALLEPAPWHVVAVEALPDFKLRARFADGVEGGVDMSGLITGRRAGVFSVLADPTRFAAVCLDQGTVTWRNALETWPNDLDLAPDAMHDQIAEHGEWTIV